MRMTWVLCCVVGLGALGACDRGAEDPTEGATATNEYSTRGEIRAIQGERVDIEHEDVPGYMPAMTMPFYVPDVAMLEGLAVGDAVAFTFAPQAGGRHVIRAITKR